MPAPWQKNKCSRFVRCRPPPSATRHPPPPNIAIAPPVDLTDSRHRILDAFADALLSGPYDHITVDALLRRAGVGRTTFYAHFRNKEALLGDSVDRLRLSLADLARHTDQPLGFIGPYLLHLDSHRAIYQSFVGRQSVQVLEHHVRRMLLTLLADDPASRSLPPATRELALHAAQGAIWSVTLAWIEHRLQADVLALAADLRQVVQAALHGSAAPGPRA